jgi:hypothetical protein
MSIIGFRITSLAVAGVLCLGLSSKGVAQMADTVNAVSDTVAAVNIETVTMTVYRVRVPAKVPTAKSEIKGHAPSKNALWVPGFASLGVLPPGSVVHARQQIDEVVATLFTKFPPASKG